MSEQRFTLDEARHELALRECAEHGHSWNVVTARQLCDRFDRPISVVCNCCGEAHPVEAAASS